MGSTLGKRSTQLTEMEPLESRQFLSASALPANHASAIARQPPSIEVARRRKKAPNSSLVGIFSGTFTDQLLGSAPATITIQVARINGFSASGTIGISLSRRSHQTIAFSGTAVSGVLSADSIDASGNDNTFEFFYNPVNGRFEGTLLLFAIGQNFAGSYSLVRAG